MVAFNGFVPFVTDVVGTPYPYAYVPNVLKYYYHPMGFWDRLGNVFLSYATRLGMIFFSLYFL